MLQYTHCEQVYLTWARVVRALNEDAIADTLRRFLCSLILDVLTSPGTRQSRPTNRFKNDTHI